MSSKYETSKSWTDDVPICKYSGVGFSYNQVYREDGNQQEDHPFEDKSFHYKFSDNGYLYGVFDGHEGTRAADFCLQHMAAELLLGQLNEVQSDEDIKELLRQAYVSVEKSYMDSVYHSLAVRISLMSRIEGLSQYQAYKEMPNVVEDIKQINSKLSSGTTAALALIHDNKLFVTNVGTCRVLLCQTDANYVLKVVQLTTDHDLKNEDELLRLTRLGIKIDNLRKHSHLGNQENTRCLGNFLVKGGYKEFEDLCMATQEPVIAEPDIGAGIQLDESCRFLLIMSAGLYRSVEEATRTEQVNKYIAQCVVEQFRDQVTLTSVAQAVVDKVVRLHHDWHMSNSLACRKREDITLIVRNFNYPLPNAINNQGNQQSVTSTQRSDRSNTSQGTLTNSDKTIAADTLETTSSSEVRNEECDTGVGEDDKVKAYVNFEDFYRKFEEAQQKGEFQDLDNMFS